MIISIGPLLNQMDSPDFAWCTKNSLRDELNIQKGELHVNKETIITNRNQAYYAELETRGLQEELLVSREKNRRHARINPTRLIFNLGGTYRWVKINKRNPAL